MSERLDGDGGGVRRWSEVGLLLAILASAPSVASAATTAPPGCSFFQPGAEDAPVQQCMDCHGLHRTHPVEIDYAAAAAARPQFYRTLDEAVRRGIYLPGGQVKCVTCHDQNSPWKYHIALPPGATPTPAVETMTIDQLVSTSARKRAAPPPGSAVTPTPLCTGCHAYDR